MALGEQETINKIDARCVDRENGFKIEAAVDDIVIWSVARR